MISKQPAKTLSIALLFFAVSLGLSAQTSPEAEIPAYPASLRVLFAGARSFDTETITADLGSLIDQSIVTALKQPGYTVVSADGPVEGAAGTVENPLFAQAKAAEAQAAVSVQYFREGPRITLIARLYDAWSGRFLTGGSRSGTVDISLLTVIDLLLSDVMRSLEQSGPRLVVDYGHEAASLLSRGMIISGPDEGATVSLEGAGTLGTIQNGTLQLDYRPLVIDQSVRFTVEKPGFYPATLEMVVGATTPEPVLPKLYPEGRLGIMFNWDPISFASFGISAKIYPVADVFYIEAGYTFVSASMRQNLGRSPDEFQVPLTYNHRIDLQTGVYLFFPPESLFRLRTGIGAGFAIFPGTLYNPEEQRNLLVSVPIVGVDLNLRPFTASISFGAEFAVDIGQPAVYPPGLIRSFQPFRISIGVLL